MARIRRKTTQELVELLSTLERRGLGDGVRHHNIAMELERRSA